MDLNNVNIEFDEDSNVTEFFIRSKICILDNVLSINECDQIIKLIDCESKFGISYQLPDLSQIIMKRCEKYLSKIVYQYDSEINNIDNSHENNMHYWHLKEINSNWKIHKRLPGNKLEPHYDRISVRDVDYKSIYTIIIYLNDSDGNVKFKHYEFESKKGRVMIFNMSEIHEGLENKNYEKIYIRSKLMFKRSLKIENKNDVEAARIYRNAIVSFSKQSKEFEKALDEAFEMSPLFERTVLNLFQ
jgi:hypothetical protein